MSENSRFKDQGNGLTSELIANQIQVFYDPTTQQVRAIFNGAPYLFLNGRYVPLGHEVDILREDITPLLAEIPCEPGDIDPVTGADLSQLSYMGMMIAFKRSFDKLHNARAARIAAEIVEAERQAAAVAARVAAAEAEAEALANADIEPTEP